MTVRRDDSSCQARRERRLLFGFRKAQWGVREPSGHELHPGGPVSRASQADDFLANCRHTQSPAADDLGVRPVASAATTGFLNALLEATSGASGVYVASRTFPWTCATTS